MTPRIWRRAVAALVLTAATALAVGCHAGSDEAATPPATVQGQAVHVSRAELAGSQDLFAWRQRRIGELEAALATAASLEQRNALQAELDHAKAESLNPPAWPLSVESGWVETRGSTVVFHDGQRVYALDPGAAGEAVEPITPLLRQDLAPAAQADGLAWLRAQAGG